MLSIDTSKKTSLHQSIFVLAVTDWSCFRLFCLRPFLALSFRRTCSGCLDFFDALVLLGSRGETLREILSVPVGNWARRLFFEVPGYGGGGGGGGGTVCVAAAFCFLYFLLRATTIMMIDIVGMAMTAAIIAASRLPLTALSASYSTIIVSRSVGGFDCEVVGFGSFVDVEGAAGVAGAVSGDIVDGVSAV